MEYQINTDFLKFNPKPPIIMHIDLNSCFATIEQQANRHLRGKPIAVAAYNSPGGCILAPSIESKALGRKTGMKVKDGKILCPDLIVLEPDPWKYRNVHLKLRNLLKKYTNDVVPKSIDEFVLNFEGYPSFEKGMFYTGRQIKQEIKEKIGEWLTVSVGIAPNRFLAKTASGLNKPDGLDEININNFKNIFASLKLPDLCGIASNNTVRLNNVGIYTVLDFYNASLAKLKSAFASICGYHWYLRLRGWEVDDVEFERKSFGNSFALPKPLTEMEDLAPILHKLVQKTNKRMRLAGFKCQGVHVSVLYRDGTHWHIGRKTQIPLFYWGDIYKKAYKMLIKSPYKKPVHTLAVSCFNLSDKDVVQNNLFDEVEKKKNLANALDYINEKWGDFVITPAKMLSTQNVVIDRISFGGVKELIGQGGIE
mgnify:CR=1 FL=1